MANSKMKNRGKNINEILDPNNAPTDSIKQALRRTLLAKKLNTGRCTTPQELAQRFNLLFETALEDGFVPTIEMLGLCSGYDRRTIWQIEQGTIHKGDGMQDVVKEAKDLIGAAEAQLALSGDINATVYIFRGKNFQGMTDKQEVVVTPNTGLSEQTNVEEILNNLPQVEEHND